MSGALNPILQNKHIQYNPTIKTYIKTLHPVWQVPLLLLRAVRFGNPWIKVDLCTGKLVELGGD